MQNGPIEWTYFQLSVTGNRLKIETYYNFYVKEKLKFRILSADGTNIRFSFLYLTAFQKSDTADESANCRVV